MSRENPYSPDKHIRLDIQHRTTTSTASLDQQEQNKCQAIFTEHLPDSLYMSPKELNYLNAGTKLSAWKKFLDNPETQRTIERELAKEMEIAARKSIQKLTNDNSTLTSNDINAIKEILSKSKIIQEKNQSKETIVLSFIPPRKEIF